MSEESLPLQDKVGSLVIVSVDQYCRLTDKYVALADKYLELHDRYLQALEIIRANNWKENP